MKYHGYIEKELGGKVRGFQFGMGAFFIMSEEWGEEIGSLEAKIAKVATKKDPTHRELLELLRYNRMMVYAALKNYDLINDNKIDYNFYKFSAWADEMSTEDWKEITEFSAKTREVAGEEKANQ